MSKTNLHPADELHVVRQKIAELRKREKELRDAFVDGDFETVGEFARVEVETHGRAFWDWKKVAKLPGAHHCKKLTEYQVVKTFEL